jgi:HD-GYP domain-containing protein (c-di-GMP phosphodiesterase class II)
MSEPTSEPTSKPDSAPGGGAKSGISLSKVLNDGVRKYGTLILSNLAIAIKVTKLYSFAHQNVSDAIRELLEFLHKFVRMEGSAVLMRNGDFLFLNEVRIRVDLGGLQSFNFIVGLLKERDIGEICFNEGTAPQELQALVDLFNKSPPDEKDRWGSFSKAAGRCRLPTITFTQHVERADMRGELSDDTRVVAIRTYFKAITIMDDVLDCARANRKFSLRRMKLAVHALVDLTLSEVRLLLALVNTKARGAPGSNHAVNVAVLAIALGAKMGLSKRLLGDLGIAALLHDVGKVDLPEPLRAACLERLPPSELETYRSHVASGVERLLTQRAMNSIVKSINVAFLHHYRYDRTGYPKLLATKEQNLFTRIVAVADHYDNATTPQRLAPKAQLPEAVMRDLMDRKGTEFDPLVVKAFVNLMGLYPVGCVVRLDTGEVGTVVEPATTPRFLDRPVVKLVSDAAGNPTEERVDLLERGPGGRFLRSVLKIYQQEEVRLDLEEYLAVI